MSFAITMSRALTLSMESFAEKVLADAVERLASKYGFNPAEATEFLLSGGVHVKLPPLEKAKLPWCGVVDASCCKAIVKNGGLFTQCTSGALDGGWCKKCAKDVEKNGTPTNGDVEARLAVDIMTYKVGNTEVKPYIEYMLKNNLTREQVEESAQAHGLSIDPRQFEKKKRGRKNTTPRAMVPAVETPHPPVEDDVTETSTALDLGALHRARVERTTNAVKAAASSAAASSAAASSAASSSAAAVPEPLAPLQPPDRKQVEDDTVLTVKKINEMKKEDAQKACEVRGIYEEGMNVLDMKKKLKETVK